MPDRIDMIKTLVEWMETGVGGDWSGWKLERV